MSYSVAIKNSILFFLILLIFHFSFKNALKNKSKDDAAGFKASPGVESQPEDLFAYVYGGGGVSGALDIGLSALQGPPPAIGSSKKQQKNEVSNNNGVSSGGFASGAAVVNQYPNETPMNGGVVFGSLNGFDGFGNQFGVA